MIVVTINIVLYNTMIDMHCSMSVALHNKIIKLLDQYCNKYFFVNYFIFYKRKSLIVALL